MIQWDGISPIGFQFRLRRGASPSFAHVTGFPNGVVRQSGPLSIQLSDGTQQVFQDCKVMGGRQDGPAPSWLIADRRWRWDESPIVDADWNSPWLGGLPFQGGQLHERLPQDIAKDLFGMMGESAPDVSALPNVNKTTFRFSGDRANKALEKFCRLFGCEPGIDIDGNAKIFKIGADQRPTGLPVRHNTHRYAGSGIGKVIVEFGPTLFQDDFALETMYRFKDVFNAGSSPESILRGIWGNWPEQMWDFDWNNPQYQRRTQYPAQDGIGHHWKSLKRYRIVGTWRSDGIGRPTRGFDIKNYGVINEIEQVIPYNASTEIDSLDVPQVDRTSSTITMTGLPGITGKRYPYIRKRPWVTGVFSSIGMLGVSSPFPEYGDISGWRQYAVYPHPFVVLPELIVEFMYPVFEIRSTNPNSTTVGFTPVVAPCCDLKLTTSFHLIGNDGRIVRHRVERQVGQGQDVLVRLDQMYLRHESVLNFTPLQPGQPSVERYVSNTSHIESSANVLIDDIAGMTGDIDKEYAICDGLLRVDLNGVISEVAWRWRSYDVKGGISTEVVAND